MNQKKSNIKLGGDANVDERIHSSILSNTICAPYKITKSKQKTINSKHISNKQNDRLIFNDNYGNHSLVS